MAASYGISLTSSLAIHKYSTLSQAQSAYIGFLATVAIGLVKEELIDSKRDWRDYGADVLGAGIGVGVSFIL